MADISSGAALAQALDTRNTRAVDRISRARDSQTNTDDTRVNDTQSSERANDVQRADTLDQQRRLDDEERQRDRQLAADLQAAQVRRDDANAAANAQADEAPPRGSLVDLYA